MNLLRLKALSSLAVVSLAVACNESSGPSPEAEPKTETTRQALDTPTGFDFDNGNITADYMIPFISPLLSGTGVGVVSGGDASIIINVTTTLMAGFFDAIAPYGQRMKGIHSRIPRRPASEGANERNRNIACMHAGYQMLKVLLPQLTSNWRTMLTSKGIDPDDNSLDSTTPAGIGNIAAKAVLATRGRDGMNRDGDETGKKYNLKMYEDYTGYEPVNSPFELTDPSRWQPRFLTRGNGLFQIQRFVTPQWGRTKPYSMSRRQMKNYAAPKPTKSDPKKNFAGYKEQVDEIITASANLTDQKKMVAEFFNHKNQSLGRGGDFIRLRDGQSNEEWIQYDFLLQVAAFDGGISTWADKVKYDTVRPFSAVKYLYAKKKLRAWGGVGKGTVNDITGNEWESYLPTADHPEYPSGSTCFCAAQAQASRRWTGSDQFGWNVVRLKGSSVIEPGITPASDVTMSFPTFTDWENQCRQSRIDGGVHFAEATSRNTVRVCEDIADRAYDFIMKYVNGDHDANVVSANDD